MALTDTLQYLAKSLYPIGRAFRMQEGGVHYRLHRALNSYMAQVYNDVIYITFNQLPDNPNFTIDDAHDWYRRLGIYDSGNVSLDDMKAAITQKLSFPVTPLNKQSGAYIEQQLQAAGFNVKVYQNRFSDGMGGYTTKTPVQILGAISGTAQYADFEYGQKNFGGDFNNKVANYLEQEKDSAFTISDYRYTFYIAGANVSSFASVPAARKQEFRQLVLKLKAQHMVAFLFVTYV